MPLQNLGEFEKLVNPKNYNKPLDVAGVPFVDLFNFLKSMILIRKVEARIAIGRKEGVIGGPVHLGSGQEAIAVGVAACLQRTDRVFGAHRSHSHLLALNPEPYKLFAETLGRATGFSKGMGGSMHLWDANNGFFGSTPIVAGTVPLAVGAGMAAKLQLTDDVGVAYFGDGAMEEGVVNESLNLATVQKSQVLFVAENNQFSSHLHISLRQPSAILARFAAAHSIPYRIVDGNDILSVRRAAQELLLDARAGKNPGFLEAVTYRWFGHVDWREDIDVGVNRSFEDRENWLKRDPIMRLSLGMINSGFWSREQELELNKEIDSIIEIAWERALKDPTPDKLDTMKYVYSV